MFFVLDDVRIREVHIDSMYDDGGHCMFVVLDDVRIREVHIDSMYDDGGHNMFVVSNHVLYIRCHRSTSMRRNGNISPDLLLPCKFNRNTDVFVVWSIVK